MFTGIITDIGVVIALKKAQDARMTIRTSYKISSIAFGASIACSGACMTVVEKGEDSFTIEVSAESLSRTTLGQWKIGTEINLERSLAVGDELGGHIVSGHVDGVAVVREIAESGDTHKLTLEVPPSFSKYIAEKGSITLDGVALTVNGVEGNCFWVTLIPHTWQYTTMKYLKPGEKMNFEIDMLARYVERMLGR